MGRFNPEVAIQEISSDPRVTGRPIKAGTFQGSGVGSATFTSGGVGQAMYVPIDFGAGGYADSFSINCTTLGATSQYRLALYKASLTTGLPGGLVVDLGALDVTATGVKVSTVAAQKVAGLMYVMCSPQGSNVAVISAGTGVSAAAVVAPYITQATAVAGLFTGVNTGYSEAGITAAPPATATPVLSTNNIPIVVWRWTALPQF